MKTLFAAVLVAGTLAGFSAADAAGGCGPGFHRGPYGGCRPQCGAVVGAPRVVAPPPVGAPPPLVGGPPPRGCPLRLALRFWGRPPRRGSPRRGRPRPCRGRAARARLPVRLRLALWALPPDLSVTSRTIVISPHRDGDMGNRATRASRLSMPLALRFFLLSALC